MRFNCGLTDEEKTRRNCTKERFEQLSRECELLKDRGTAWFAWYPVRVGEEDCRWLETVCLYYQDVYVAGERYDGRIGPRIAADHWVFDGKNDGNIVDFVIYKEGHKYRALS